jgi:hypothetical protein
VSDPVEAAMEEALRPGRYISEHASSPAGLRRTDISYAVFRNPAWLAVTSRVQIAPFSAARSLA